MLFSVEKSVFGCFPGMKIVCVAARGVGEAVNGEAVSRLLAEGWKTAGEAAAAHGNPQSHPYVLPWVEHMKEAGAPRKKFPSSIEALLKRAGKGGEPFRIQPAVDFYNAVSLSCLVPAGGFDIDQLENGLVLRFSRDGDRFQALDSDTEEAIPAGEISYADGDIIVTRHFVWKQSKHALINPGTRNIVFVSEIPGELPEETTGIVAGKITDGLRECFGVEAAAQIVDEDNSSVEIA